MKNLNEQIERINRLTNYQVGVVISEQTTEYSSISSIFSNMTKSIGAGINSLTSKFSEIFGGTPERISLIFPKSGWETIATKILKIHGVVSGVFRSTDEAIQSIKALKNEGVKAKELVIGSHGNGKTLLITQKEGTYTEKYSPDLLKNVKEIISKDSIVFFTACHGADYLVNLVDAANRLGVGVYGSRGIYNYITNSSEEGYYYCNPYKIPEPKKVTEPRDEFYSGKLEIKESGYNMDDKDSVKISFFGPFGKEPKLKIEFNPTSFYDLGWELKSKEPLSFIVKGKISSYEEDYGTKDAKEIYGYEFYLNKSDFEYERSLGEIGFTSLLELLKNGKFRWSTPNRKNFGTKLKKSIEKGNVKLIIGDVDLTKERPKIKGYFIKEVGYDANTHLIESGVCKKVNNAPISWINPNTF